MVALALFSLTPLGSAAAAAEVVGKVEVTTAAGGKREQPTSAYLRPIPNGFLPVRPRNSGDPSTIVLALVGRQAGVARGCTYALRNGSVNTTAWIAQQGATLSIINRDGVPYEIFAEGLSAFAPMPTAPGKTRTVKVASAGKWPIFDKNFDHVRGALHVVKKLSGCAVPDASGSFRMNGVEGGTYSLMAFHGTKMLKKTSVRIAPSGKTKIPAIRLTLPPRGSGDRRATGGAKP